MSVLEKIGMSKTQLPAGHEAGNPHCPSCMKISNQPYYAVVIPKITTTLKVMYITLGLRNSARDVINTIELMALRHSIALTLIGWYLMVPAESTKNPLSQWRSYRSFDTAEECQTAIDAHLEVLKKHQQDHTRFDRLNPQERLKEATKEAEWEYDFENAQCIATDDPRLKESK
jgi:hypothetical protein